MTERFITVRADRRLVWLHSFYAGMELVVYAFEYVLLLCSLFMAGTSASDAFVLTDLSALTFALGGLLSLYRMRESDIRTDLQRSLWRASVVFLLAAIAFSFFAVVFWELVDLPARSCFAHVAPCVFIVLLFPKTVFRCVLFERALSACFSKVYAPVSAGRDEVQESGQKRSVASFRKIWDAANARNSCAVSSELPV